MRACFAWKKYENNYPTQLDALVNTSITKNAWKNGLKKKDRMSARFVTLLQYQSRLNEGDM
jgi:hypothetical protein